MRLHTLGVLALVVYLPARGMAATIIGACVDGPGRAPLAGVEVVARAVPDSTRGAHTVSDSAGRFRLERLVPGRYRLRASLLGHAPVRLDSLILTEIAPIADVGTLVLTVSPIAIPGVETSTARANAILASDRNIYLAKDLPAAAAGNTIDLLRSVPELDVDINERVSLRGSSSVTVHINGRASPLKGDALTAFLRQLPGSRIERVEVIANPSAKFDPEGMAGIVNLVTKEPLDLGTSGSIFLSLGDRGGGPGARIARQQGKLTLSGGLSGYWNRLDYRYEDLRHNLLAQPPSAYRLGSDSHYGSGYGNSDASFDYAFDKRNTLYGTLSGYVSDSRNDVLSGYELSNTSQGVTSRYDRSTDGASNWRSGNATLGFAHVVEKSRNEYSLEFRQTATPNRYSSDATQQVRFPVDSLGLVSHQTNRDRSRERSLQVDDTHPLGKKGKLELGYRGLERRTASTSLLSYSSGGLPSSLSDYVHHERFHSGYLTVGSTWGRFSFQGGLRAEAADTRFEVIPRATSYDSDYRSAFPSANAAWDLGHGRTLRLTYSKRIERPSPYLLNPDIPNVDTLNRTTGNPFLSPKYTHSYTFDASWAGSRGLLRVSPFYRETIHNWDQFKSVDTAGVAVTTWLNASSVRAYGTSFVASLRQTGRVGGTLNLSLYRELHDASNLSASAQQDATTWTMSFNVTFKTTKALDLQGFGRYNPAQTLAQGRISGLFYSNLGARYKFNDAAWASFFVSDPFDLWRYKLASSDESYSQTSTNRGSLRRFGLGFGWSWGKPPETKQRKQTDDAPPTEQPGPGR